MKHVRTANKDLGTENDMLDLIERIQGFAYDTATETDQLVLTRALKVLADDIIARHEKVRSMQADLSKKLKVADVVTEMNSVLHTITPPPQPKPIRPWWSLRR